jgi:predicted nucleotidyltransferase
VLAGLHTPNSDVDIVAYGAENCLRVRQSAEKLLNEGLLVKRYSEGGLRGLFRFRSQDTIMPFRDFVRHERRKTIQGTFRGRDFFLRYVKGRNQVGEVYGDRVYRPGDRVTIRARITSDAESIFTPCSYKVADVEVTKGRFEGLITEITSFRGRFCEQARTEETVEASGTLERVELRSGGGMNRVLLGNDKEDFMRVVDFEHAKQL